MPIKRIFKLLYNDFVINNVAKVLHIQVRPRQINYSLTLRCNCACVMCPIGTNYKKKIESVKGQKLKTELSLQELNSLLQSSLFTKVRDIGISGGEPFMVPELEDYVAVILKRLKGLSSLTISSNLILTQRVVELAPKINELCRSKGVRFRISASLDGVGEMHNTIRRRPAAFECVSKSLTFLENQGIGFVVGSTISKKNLTGVFALWNYLKRSGYVGNFRLAVFIDRLDNERDATVFCNGEYEAWEFFSKLAHDYSDVTSLERRIFYRHLIQQMESGIRTYGCRFQSESLFMGELGELAHCAVYGHPFYKDLSKDPLQEWKSPKADAIKSKMLSTVCGTCRHDYRGPIRISDLLREIGSKVKLEQFKTLGMALPFLIKLRRGVKKVSFEEAVGNSQHIAITGWYGTETVGDKAILAGIISFIEANHPSQKVSVVSCEPFYTKETLRELNADYMDIISFNDLYALKGVDLIIFGGGPMMDLVEMGTVLRQFDVVRNAGGAVGLVGVGIGPDRWRLTRHIIKQMSRMSSVAVFRDEKSVEIAKGYVSIGHEEMQYVGDPAEWFFKQQLNKFEQNKNVLGINIRKWPKKYAGTYSERQRAELRQIFFEEVVSIGKDWLSENEDHQIRLIPMNTYWRGDDDREILAELHDTLNDTRVLLYDGPAVLSSIVEAIGGCGSFLGMRYHSGVAAYTLGCKTIAVDYTTGGGKVSAFFECKNDALVIPFQEFNADSVIRFLNT